MPKPKCVVAAALCIAAGCTAVVQAQPDVIVGDLPDVSNYTTAGAVSGIHAYAVGTTSCNMGTTPLTWIDEGTSNIYPVISQNMYRLVNGRFEQIGQAWLKHGFCALNQTVCGSCPTVPGGHSCDHLDPGCSDPYSSGLNGSQGGLGPKHVVNPATGFFPGDATALIGTNTGNATIKARLQVLQSDLNTPGALYFVSSTYIQPEDAAANVDNNNQSYRRVNVSGTNYGISLTDSTKREQPAIFAWQQYGGGASGGTGVNDPSVVLTPVDIAGDGRFWIGSKVIDLGGGSYRYEYAVYNHNSHRGASSFSVPLTGSTTTSAYYFHDVPYHSGEIQAGTDWGVAPSASSVAWTYANDQANDANENVLRWDTIYNYSFIANAAPTTGAVTLGIFGAGSPSSVNATALVPGTGGGGGGAPFNDSCANALSVSAGSFAFSNVNATTDGPVECLFSGDSQINADVWFRYTSGTCTDPMTISTCGSAYDTKLAVYQGNTCPSTTSAIACNDDTTGCTGGTANLGSSVTFTPTANTTYLIRVGGYTPSGGTATTGNGTLTITPGTCAPQPPANDVCANAQWAAAGITYTGDTTLATDDGTSSCGTSSASPDVWYKYKPQTSGSVTVATCGSAYDTVVSVHSACGLTNISGACNDDACAGGGGNLGSSIAVNMTAGTTYLVRVTGYNGSVGTYNLLITGGGGVVPPSNDDCAGRIGYNGTIPFSTVGASTDGVTTPCGQVFNEIWYNYPAACNGTATLTATGNAGFAPSLAVYNGGTCAATYMACVDASGTTATLNFPVTQGNSYAIRVGGNANGLTGTGTLSISCTPSGPTCDSVDFNGDGLFPDTADIDDFLSVFSGGSCSTGTCGDTDFNNDGLFPDTLDIDALLSVFSGGPCL
ncbi:MAG TPA: hypothetical protein VHN77_05470 [Phycisphaerales bacterium]|nr:hypothetical protein [Phycisphaerales bacterium]